MKSRTTLAVCLLALATLNCSDAVPPPASIGMTINLFGKVSVSESIPTTVRNLNLLTSEMALDEMELLEDGDDGATVNCKVEELTPGSSHTISITYRDEKELTQYSLSATTMANASAGGYVSIKTPLTAGTTYQSRACTVQTARAKEGGGAIVAHFQCNDPIFLNDISNCAVDGPCDSRLNGDIFVFVKNCSK